jgi:ADP-dependent phosphofructokinase/glucokinase
VRRGGPIGGEAMSAFGPVVAEPTWRRAFDALAAAVPDFAAAAKPLLTGFAACVDKLIDLHAAAPALKREPAGRILFDELMARARAGRGGEVEVDWPDGPRFLDAFAKPEATAIGGTSAQAATSLACLGAPAVMALADRSAGQLAVLHPAVRLVGADGTLVPAGDVRPEGSGKPAHYIVEYSAGRPLPDFTPQRSTRVIVRFAAEDIEDDPLFERYGRGLSAGAGAALLSSPNAVDAERLTSALDRMASFARAWKAAGIAVHLELGEYPLPGALDQTLRRMAGSVTSIGLNFNELRSVGLDPAALEAQMAAFAERYDLARLVVHADPWALAVTREDPERELDALAMGCLLASARAEAGRPVARPRAPAAAEFVRPPHAAFSAAGGSPWQVVCCAAPYLRNPVSTVGLGDTFTAGTMLVHAGPAGRPPILADLPGFLVASGAAGSRQGPSSGLSAANNMRS